jgi:hypothetical protein
VLTSEVEGNGGRARVTHVVISSQASQDAEKILAIDSWDPEIIFHESVSLLFHVVVEYLFSLPPGYVRDRLACVAGERRKHDIPTSSQQRKKEKMFHPSYRTLAHSMTRLDAHGWQRLNFQQAGREKAER